MTVYGARPAGSPPPQAPAGPPVPPPPPVQPAPPHQPPGPYPPYGTPPPPPRRSRRGRFLLLGILGAVSLLLLCAGTAVVAMSYFSDDEDDLELAWSLDLIQPGPDEPNIAHQWAGSWLLDQTLVRAQHDRVTAYRVSDGSEQWELTVPADTTICRTSPEPDGGVVAIVYGPADRCDQLAGLDLTTGQQVWEAEVPHFPIDLDDVFGLVMDPRQVPEQLLTVGGAALVYTDADLLNREVVAYSIADGSPRWRLTEPAGCVFEGVNADAQTVVVGEICGSAHTVIGFDLATGDEKWRTSLTEQQRPDRVLSVSPTIIVMENPDLTGEISVLDEAGTVVQTIPRKPDGVEFREDGRGVYDFSYLIHQEILYVGLETGVDAPDGQIAAFDLQTGELRWTSTGHSWRPIMISVADDGLLALEGNGHDESIRLVRVDLATGEAGAIAQGPAGVLDPFTTYLIHERDGVIAVMTVPWTALEGTTAVRVLLPLV